MVTFRRTLADEPIRNRQPPAGAIRAGTGYVRPMPRPFRTRFQQLAFDAGAPTRRSEWVACRQYGSELEASIGVAILDGSGIPAIVRSNDSVGLFGSAFQGFSAMGVTLLVPSSALAAAQTALALAKPSDDGDE